MKLPLGSQPDIHNQMRSLANSIAVPAFVLIISLGFHPIFETNPTKVRNLYNEGYTARVLADSY